MADRIKGITVEIGGDTTKLSDALKNINKSIKDTQNQLKDVNKLLKLDPGNTDLLVQKQKYLSQAISDTKEKLKQEEAALKQLKDAPQTEETIRQQEALTREIEDTKQSLKGLEDQYKSVGSVAGVQLQQAGQKMKDIGDKITGVGTSLSTHVTAPITAVGAASLAAFTEVDAGADIVKTKTGAAGQGMEIPEGRFHRRTGQREMRDGHPDPSLRRHRDPAGAGETPEKSRSQERLHERLRSPHPHRSQRPHSKDPPEPREHHGKPRDAPHEGAEPGPDKNGTLLQAG